MKAFMTFLKPTVFEVPQRNVKIKVYVNFILIKSLGTLGRVNISNNEDLTMKFVLKVRFESLVI